MLATEDLGGLSPRALYWADGPVKMYIPGRIRRPQTQSASQSPAQSQVRRSRRNIDRVSNIVQYGGDTVGEVRGRIIAIADCVGDWREEIITSVEGELRVYTSTILSTRRHVGLMQDPLYRTDTALQAMGYFYPPQLSYYLK